MYPIKFYHFIQLVRLNFKLIFNCHSGMAKDNMSTTNLSSRPLVSEVTIRLSKEVSLVTFDSTVNLYEVFSANLLVTN